MQLRYCLRIGVRRRFIREQRRRTGDQGLHLVGSRAGQRLSAPEGTPQSRVHLRRGHIPQASFVIMETGFPYRESRPDSQRCCFQVRGVESRVVERGQTAVVAAAAVLPVCLEYHVSIAGKRISRSFSALHVKFSVLNAGKRHCSSEYTDWRPGLGALLQPIPFPEEVLTVREVQESVLMCVMRRLARDPRCTVHRVLLPVREPRPGWIHIAAPSSSACPDRGELFGEMVRFYRILPSLLSSEKTILFYFFDDSSSGFWLALQNAAFF